MRVPPSWFNTSPKPCLTNTITFGHQDFKIWVLGRYTYSDHVCMCSVTQFYPTLYHPMDYSLPDSSVRGILQARILEWVAVSSSRWSFQPRDQTQFSCVSWFYKWIVYQCATWEALECEWMFSHSVMSDSATHGLQPTRLFCPWDFPGKDTGMVCHFLLQGIFLTQGSNLGLLHCRQALYQLSYQGSP